MSEQSRHLAAFSDEQLWALVHQPFALAQDARLHELMTLGKTGTLLEGERSELEELIAEHDWYVLVRSQALLMLKQRGCDVERHLKLGA